MKKLRLLLLTAALLVPFTLTAQTPAPASTIGQQATTEVDGHLNKLTEALSLSTEQREKVRPILQHFLDKRAQILANSQLSDSERKTKVEAIHDRADKQVRELLNEEQKEKLTQLEQSSHTH